MTAATEEPTGVVAHRFGPGLGFALLSALSFGASGTVASGLLRADWTPALAVTLRITIGALALLPFTLRALHRRWHLLRENAWVIGLYGAFAVGLAQTCYFFAIERIPVGPALLIEYIAPIAVLLWQWAVHHQRPTRLIVLGTIVAFAGLLLVLGLTTDTPLDPIGVLWASFGMLGAAGFFILSARPDTGLPPMALAGGGLAVGSVVQMCIRDSLRTRQLEGSHARQVGAGAQQLNDATDGVRLGDGRTLGLDAVGERPGDDAVSYTHLDVYKRQVHDRGRREGPPAHEGDRVRPDRRPRRRPHRALRPRRTHPVSYTHLDVYKRQGSASW